MRIRCPVCLGDGYVSDNPRCYECGEKLASWAEVSEHVLKDHPSKELDQAVAEDSSEDKHAVGLDLPEEQSADSRQVGNEPETTALVGAAERVDPTPASNSPGESSKPQDADVVALEQARNVVISRQKFVLGTCILGLFLLGVLLLISPANDYLFVEIYRLLNPHNPSFATSYWPRWQQWITVVGVVFVFLSSAIVSYALIPRPWQSRLGRVGYIPKRLLTFARRKAASSDADTVITLSTCGGCGGTEWRYTGIGDLWNCKNPRCRSVRRHTESRSTVGRGDNQGRSPRVGRFSGHFRTFAILIAVCVAVVATILVMHSTLFDKQNIVNEISHVKSVVSGFLGDEKRNIVNEIFRLKSVVVGLIEDLSDTD